MCKNPKEDSFDILSKHAYCFAHCCGFHRKILIKCLSIAPAMTTKLKGQELIPVSLSRRFQQNQFWDKFVHWLSFFVWRAPSYPTCQLKKKRIFIKQSKLLKVFIWTCEWNNARQSFRLITAISINDGYRNLDKSHWISDKKGKQKGKKSVKIHKLRGNTSGILYIRNSFLKYHSFFYDKWT